MVFPKLFGCLVVWIFVWLALFCMIMREANRLRVKMEFVSVHDVIVKLLKLLQLFLLFTPGAAQRLIR